MPFPAVQEDLVVDKSINPRVISIEQKTFESVEEGLSFFRCDKLAAEAHGVRRPPPSGEWSVGIQSQMDVALAPPREKTFSWVEKPPGKSLSPSSVEIPSLLLADLNWNCLASGVSEQLSSRN